MNAQIKSLIRLLAEQAVKDYTKNPQHVDNKVISDNRPKRVVVNNHANG